jgi:hypothetical protein
MAAGWTGDQRPSDATFVPKVQIIDQWIFAEARVFCVAAACAVLSVDSALVASAGRDFGVEEVVTEAEA